MLLIAVFFTHVIIVMSIAHLMCHSIVSLLESNPNSALLSVLRLALVPASSVALVSILGQILLPSGHLPHLDSTDASLSIIGVRNDIGG